MQVGPDSGLISKFLKDIITQFDEEQQKRLIDAIKTIAKCYHGKANIESALEQSGVGIVDIKLQREAILNCAKHKILEKFSDLNNETRFLTVLKANILALGDSVGNYKDPKTNVIDFWLNSWLKYKFIPHNTFLKALTRTLNETDLSIHEIPIETRSKVSELFKVSLQYKGSIQEVLTDVEQKLCQTISKSLDKDCNEKTTADATNFLQHRFDTYQAKDRVKRESLFQELQNHQDSIQEGVFLGKYGLLAKRDMPKKCADAAENRLKNNKGNSL